MSSDTMKQIEENQRALRESIEQSKRLADYSDRLIKRHREERDRETRR